MNIEQVIRNHLENHLDLAHLDIKDRTGKHVHHEQFAGGHHLSAIIVSDTFESMPIHPKNGGNVSIKILTILFTDENAQKLFRSSLRNPRFTIKKGRLEEIGLKSPFFYLDSIASRLALNSVPSAHSGHLSC